MVQVTEEYPPRAPPAWPPGHKYGLPCQCKMHPGEKRVKYVQPDRAISFKPERVYRKPDAKMPNSTTYKYSFEGFEPGMLRNCRGKPMIARENLTPAGDFSDLTTHKLSYGAWPGVTKQKIYYPRDHKLSGEGPMAEITTQKHDYTPKCIDALPKIIRPNNLGLSKEPIDDGTIMNLSYKCPDYRCFQPSHSYKPETRYMPPTTPLEDETIHKLSFMPWEPQPKQDMPWARAKPYKSPREKLDGNTIYNGSYMAPGRLIEDPAGHCQGCYCVTPAECFAETGARPNAETCPVGYNPNKDPPRPPPKISDEYYHHKDG